ncbi:hypothetical protein Ancab_022757 [Ancistrocladus abbreviatus]
MDQAPHHYPRELQSVSILSRLKELVLPTFPGLTQLDVEHSLKGSNCGPASALAFSISALAASRAEGNFGPQGLILFTSRLQLPQSRRFATSSFPTLNLASWAFVLLAPPSRIPSPSADRTIECAVICTKEGHLASKSGKGSRLEGCWKAYRSESLQMVSQEPMNVHMGQVIQLTRKQRVLYTSPESPLERVCIMACLRLHGNQVEGFPVSGEGWGIRKGFRLEVCELDN